MRQMPENNIKKIIFGFNINGKSIKYRLYKIYYQIRSIRFDSCETFIVDPYPQEYMKNKVLLA